MTTYEQAVHRFKVAWLARAVIDSNGSTLAASRVTGVHRNTFQRVLSPAGYTPARLRRLAKIHGPKAQAAKIKAGMRKPMAAEPVIDFEGRKSA
jgi:hypothetical protein